MKIDNVLKLEKLSDTSVNVFERLLTMEYKKIIVKRPIKSYPLNAKINYQVIGKSIRYDIFFKNQ